MTSRSCSVLVASAGILLLGASTLVDGRVDAQTSSLRFESVHAGVDFVHVNGRTDSKHLPETMGAGLAWTDYDRDGDDDLYLVQSGWLPGMAPVGADQPLNVLFRNDGTGQFSAAPAGVGDNGYGQGATLADYDDDGFPDLYVTNFGANVLYRNNGDGTFSEAMHSGTEEARWSSSAAWGDLDGDGDVDLFVVNYVVYDIATALVCGGGPGQEASYCHIDLFDGLGDALFRNNGDGTFTDVAESAGVVNPLEGKGLGVVLGDLDDDGQTDIFVANDTQQNFLYRNLGELRFEDEGLFSGTGYSGEGLAQAGMGAEMSDLDGDGSNEIMVTNFAFENNNLYREFGAGAYLDDAFALGFGEGGLATLAFGIIAVDADGDGDREVAVANGHILDTVEQVQDGPTYAQPNHLFRNRLVEQRRALGGAAGLPADWRPSSELLELVPSVDAGFELAEVSRGLAVADFNIDGVPDLVFTNNGGPVRLMRNTSGAQNGRLVVRVRGRAGQRDALGALVSVTPSGDAPTDGVAGLSQVAEVRSGVSYASQSSGDLYFGLGGNTTARVSVRWPDGTSDDLGEVGLQGAAGATLLLVRQGMPVLARALE